MNEKTVQAPLTWYKPGQSDKRVYFYQTFNKRLQLGLGHEIGLHLAQSGHLFDQK